MCGDSAREVGEFTLRLSQRETVGALRRALAAHGGALLADAPGTGKTVLALAVAAQYSDVLVIVPAAVRAQWIASASRAGASIRVATLEAVSQGLQLRAAALIVVDEAHHVRNATTARYRAVARLAVDAHLLLLTATPVVNTARDCDALLALFLGARVNALDAQTRATVIVRRAAPPLAATTVKRLPLLVHAADVPGLAQALRALPPPLPVKDGAAATALVRITLAMAWASSLAALDAALRRRIQRGAALADVLADGRWPTRDALRAWVIGDDATQLAFSFSMPADEVPPADATHVLAKHCDAVQSLRELIAPHVARDTTARAASLRTLLIAESPRRVAVLAHHAVSVRALYQALRGEASIVAITGARVHAAAGRWSRDELLAALGPQAKPWRADDPRGVRLIIATDILAEGVELQGISTLVFGDLAWTPARLEQRVGRVAREGQREIVHVTRFATPKESRPLLRLAERLLAKHAARRAALKPASHAAPLRRAVRAWRDANTIANRIEQPIAAINAPRCGFLALVQHGDTPQLLGGEFGDGRWRILESPRALGALARDASGDARPLIPAHLSTVRRVIVKWARAQSAHVALGQPAALSNELQKSARQRVERALASVALSDRTARASDWSGALQHVSAQRGIGSAHALQSLLRQSSSDADFVANLTANTKAMEPPHTPARRLRILALLVLVKPNASD